MPTLAENQFKKEIKKLHENALEMGWGFSFSCDKYPIVVTFTSLVKDEGGEQQSFLPGDENNEEAESKEKAPKMIKFIITPIINFDISDKLKISDGTLTYFKNSVRKIVQLYYFMVHHKLQDNENLTGFFGKFMEEMELAALEE